MSIYLASLRPWDPHLGPPKPNPECKNKTKQTLENYKMLKVYIILESITQSFKVLLLGEYQYQKVLQLFWTPKDWIIHILHKSTLLWTKQKYHLQLTRYFLYKCGIETKGVQV